MKKSAKNISISIERPCKIIDKHCGRSHDYLKEVLPSAQKEWFHTERTCVWVLFRDLFANMDKNTLLSIIMVGTEEN